MFFFLQLGKLLLIIKGKNPKSQNVQGMTFTHWNTECQQRDQIYRPHASHCKSMIGKKTQYEKTQQVTSKPPTHSKTAHIPSTGKKNNKATDILFQENKSIN